MPCNEIMERLQAAGISTRPGIHAVHMLGYYKEKFGLQKGYPGVHDCNNHSMAIPPAQQNESRRLHVRG